MSTAAVIFGIAVVLAIVALIVFRLTKSNDEQIDGVDISVKLKRRGKG